MSPPRSDRCGVELHPTQQEALYFGKPILCLPFYMDQPDVPLGLLIGCWADCRASLSSVVLSHKIWTLISNDSFTEKAGQVRKLLERAEVQRAADFIKRWRLEQTLDDCRCQ